MNESLPNYLRAHRKRRGLSQEEIAYLLGCQDGSRISRYEHFHRVPTLQTALALEIILGASVSQLFAGLAEEASRETAKRARHLARRIPIERTPLIERKFATIRLLSVTAPDDVSFQPIQEA